jgi:cyclopropane-fatty-acyl-phospholipid synthase
LSRLRQVLCGAPVTVRLWNGREVRLSDVESVATVAIANRRTLLSLVLRPSLAFGEAYADGRLTVDGDLARMLEGINRALAGRPYERGVQARGASTRTESRHNVHAHYDLGNEFYSLWLDAEMVYTCAYYERPEASLEDAQRAKLDYVCRKLSLRPGQHVIEAGCGWGALALHMARDYGVTVTAYNISDAQLDWARERARKEGLADRVTFVDGDYRAIEGHADVFVSVGMLEHVGPGRYGDLGAVMDRVLDPRVGRGLVHFIGRNRPMAFNAWINRYIFPGAHAPSLSEVLPSLLETYRFSVLDIENLRLHYARTLAEWLRRFETHADQVRDRFDQRFVRMWRLYLASAEACFRSGDLQLFQISFARAGDTTVPLTRRSLYAGGRHGSQ